MRGLSLSFLYYSFNSLLRPSSLRMGMSQFTGIAHHEPLMGYLEKGLFKLLAFSLSANYLLNLVFLLYYYFEITIGLSSSHPLLLRGLILTSNLLYKCQLWAPSTVIPYGVARWVSHYELAFAMLSIGCISLTGDPPMRHEIKGK